MEAYLPTLGLRSVQSNVKQYLLFKSFILQGSISITAIKMITCNPSQHATYPRDITHITTPPTQASTHTTRASTPPMSPTLALQHSTYASTSLTSPTLTRHPHQHERQVISQTLICQTQQFSSRILADISALLFVYCC